MRFLPGPLGRFLWVEGLLSFYNLAINAEVLRESALAEVALYVASPVFLVWWAAADARRTGYWPCFHYGWWLVVLAPVLVPHYLFRTRGRSGWRLAFLLEVVMLAPAAAAYAGWWLYPYLPDYLWVGEQ